MEAKKKDIVQLTWKVIWAFQKNLIYSFENAPQPCLVKTYNPPSPDSSPDLKLACSLFPAYSYIA